MIVKIKATSDKKVDLNSLNVETLGTNVFGQFIQRVDINSIEDLIKILNDTESDLIFGKDEAGDGYFLEIYDECRE